MKGDDCGRRMASMNHLIQPPFLRILKGKIYRLLNQLLGLSTTVNILSK